MSRARTAQGAASRLAQGQGNGATPIITPTANALARVSNAHTQMVNSRVSWQDTVENLRQLDPFDPNYAIAADEAREATEAYIKSCSYYLDTVQGVSFG